MGACEFQTDSRPACTADLAPPGGDASVGPEDLAEPLAKWGPCPGGGAPCPADVATVGSPDGTVGPGNFGELLANRGLCPRVDCALEFGFGGDGSAPGSGGLGEQDWPDVEMTESLYDWLTSASLDDIGTGCGACWSHEHRAASSCECQ